VLPGLNFTGDVYVDFKVKAEEYPKVAVMPFKAPVELAGASVSDFFTTELLKTSRYELVERSQMESVLKEQEFQLSGVTDETVAVAVGKVLGVRGVVIGTISEYGYQKVGFKRAPSVGMSVRLIDSTTGKIVWSVSHNAVGNPDKSLSQHAADVVEQMVMALGRAWIDAGDTLASGLPAPVSLSAAGGVREAVLEWPTHSSAVIVGYEVLRKDPGQNDYKSLIKLQKPLQGASVTYTDRNLLDLTMYSYRVAAVSRYGLVSSHAADTDVITAGPPAPPSGLSAGSGEMRSVPLSWDASDDKYVSGYVILRQEEGGAGEPVRVTRITGRTTTKFVDGGRGSALADGTTYIYRILSFNTANVEGKPSDPVRATTCPPPSAVTGVNTVSGMPKAVTVRWTPSADGEKITGYIVYRAEQQDGPFAETGRVRGGQMDRFVDGGRGGLESGKTYFYRVSALNSCGSEGPQSAVTSATTKEGPPPVKGVKASSGGARKVTVSWRGGGADDGSSFEVHRSASKDGLYARVAVTKGGADSYEDSRLQDGMSYFYKVRVVSPDGLESEFSEAVEGTTSQTPQPPQGVACEGGDGKAVVSWRAAGGDVSKYNVYVRKYRSFSVLGESSGTSFTAENLEPGQTYGFNVTAVNEAGLESRPSQAVSCTLAK
jgi:fibronectin type 3 domain-containing protein